MQASAAACACLIGLHLRVDKEKPAFRKFGTDQHIYTTSNNSTMAAKGKHGDCKKFLTLPHRTYLEMPHAAIATSAADCAWS